MMNDKRVASFNSSFITHHSSFDFKLVSRRPPHKALDRPARSLAFIKNRVYFVGNRQLDAAPLGEELQGSRRADALGHLLHPREHVRERPPAPQLFADAAVAREPPRAGQNQIA